MFYDNGRKTTNIGTVMTARFFRRQEDKGNLRVWG
jgi:hypothetical protein